MAVTLSLDCTIIEVVVGLRGKVAVVRLVMMITAVQSVYHVLVFFRVISDVRMINSSKYVDSHSSKVPPYVTY